MENSALVAIIDFFTKTNEELAKGIFEHRITENFLSILNSSGAIIKCQKPKILQEMRLKSADYSKYCNRRCGIAVPFFSTIFS